MKKTLLTSAVLFFMSFFVITSIQAQELSMFPSFGWEYYQDDVLLTKKQFLNKLYEDPMAGTMWDKSKRQMGAAYALFGVEVGLLIYSLSREDDPSIGALIGGLGAGVGSVIFSVKAAKSRKAAVLAYNKAYTQTPFVAPSNEGFGLVYNF